MRVPGRRRGIPSDFRLSTWRLIPQPSSLIPEFCRVGHRVADERRLPVAPIARAIGRHADATIRTDRDRHRAVAVAAINPRTDVPIALDHVPLRMAEPVAVTLREHDNSWRNRAHEFGSGRGAAARM